MADYNRDEMLRQELRIIHQLEPKKKPTEKVDIEIDISDDLFFESEQKLHMKET